MSAITYATIWTDNQMTWAWWKAHDWGTRMGHKFRYVLAFLVVALSVADLVLTQTILTMVEGRTGVQPGEANALMAPIIMTWWAWPLRVGIPLIMIVHDLRKNNHWLMFVAVLLYGAVVAWNTHMLMIVQAAT